MAAIDQSVETRSGSFLSLPEPPPEFSPEQNIRGGFALRTLKTYGESMYDLNRNFLQEIKRSQDIIQKLLSEKLELKRELHDSGEKIASLKTKLDIKKSVARNSEECERIILEEIQKRSGYEKYSSTLIQERDQMAKELEMCKTALSAAQDEKEKQNVIIKEQGDKLNELVLMTNKAIYEKDELHVHFIKTERELNEVKKNMALIGQKNDIMNQRESVMREETTLLQKRIRELIDANKEVTANYQAVKKNHDSKQKEFEEILAELEEVKASLSNTHKQKKAVQAELAAANKSIGEFKDKIKSLEVMITKKEKEINDGIAKLNDTISDYEQKLERKEEQIWIMGSQINESNEAAAKAKEALATQVEAAAKSHAEPPPKTINLDADLLADLESKWQSKEKALLLQVSVLESKLKSANENIDRLNNQVSDLNKRQFHPRMERLKLIERDIKNRIEEYILGEERMETCLLCPRDLQHTYCKTCVESIVEENYHVIKCQVCAQVADAAYRNEQLESIAEQFLRRKTMIMSFLEWSKNLRVYLPPDPLNDENPNESEYLNALDFKNKRLMRLEQVRRQERENALKRRSKYKKATVEEWSRVVSELKNSWSASKEQQLEKINRIYSDHMMHYGSAMKSATGQEKDKLAEQARFRQEVEKNQQFENDRFFKSLEAFRNEENERKKEMSDKQALRDMINHIESKRALKMASIFRERVNAGIAYNFEIPHQPVGSNRLKRNNGVGYDETCYHRNFVAMKCENERDIDKLPNAWDQAAVAEEEHKILMQEKSIQLKKMQEIHSMRSQNALNAQKMDERKKLLDEEINKLVVDDRLRRKANAGEYAGFFRQLYMDIGDKELIKKFETQFNIDDGDENDAPPRHMTLRVNHQKEGSTENSIEIVKGEDNLKVLRGNILKRSN